MYEELIAELRMHHCDAKEDDTQEVCEECAYDVIIADKSVPSGIASVCVCGLMHRAADAIEELQATVDGLTAQTNMVLEETEGRTVLKFEPKWIPVTERLPKDGIFVLVCNDDEHMMIAKYETETYEWYYKYTNYDFDIWDNEEQGPVRYWMPLPSTEGLNGG